MNTRFLLICISLLMGSCSPGVGPQALRPSPVSESMPDCSSPFPRGRWQFVHAIQGSLPHGMKTSAIGVTEISSCTRAAHCILMTVEGFVLFDGVLDEGITINRAVRPFDSPAFAQGLMDDIKSVFFPPQGQLTQTGTLKNGAQVCRYKQQDGTLVDVIMPLNGGWEIRHYRQNGLIRSVHAYAGERPFEEKNQHIPARITLSRDRPTPYTLNFRLLRAEHMGERE